MSWTAATSGPDGPHHTYTRPLDNFETMFYVAGNNPSTRPYNRRQWAIWNLARLSFPSTYDHQHLVSCLKRAWIQARLFAPSVAARLEVATDGHPGLQYTSPHSTSELAEWIEQTFVVHSEDVILDQWMSDTHLNDHCVLHYLPQNHEVVMRTPHWIADGLGFYNLQNVLLGNFAADLGNNGHSSAGESGSETEYGELLEEFKGKEISRLNVSLTEAAGLTADITAKEQEYVKEAMKHWEDSLPSFGLPAHTISDETGGPGGMARVKLEFRPETLKRLLDACRKADTTIGAAVHAAGVVTLYRIVQRHQQEQNQQSHGQNGDTQSALTAPKYYTNPVTWDVRKYLNPPYNDEDSKRIGLYIGCLLLVLDPSQDFKTLLREIHKTFHSSEARSMIHKADEPHHIYGRTHAAMWGEISKMIGSTPPPEFPPDTVPLISSVGNLDGRVQSQYHDKNGKLAFEVEHVELVEENWAMAASCFQWSWRGSFFLSACFNDKAYSRKFMTNYLAEIAKVMFEGLGVEAEKVDHVE